MPQSAARVPPEADGVVISVNPKAGAQSARPRVERLAGLLADQGYPVAIFNDLDQAAREANRCHAAGRLRALVGVGGDGTAAELVNRTPAGLPLTLLPAGNENLLARHLRLAGKPESLCRTIVEGRLLQLDGCRAGGRIFLLMFSCGFDAEVVRRVEAHRRGHIRSRDYAKPIFQTIRSYKYPELRVWWDDDLPSATTPAVQSPSAVVRWLFAFNLPCYAGRLRLAPGADGTDGLLDICAFRRGSFVHGVRYLAAVLLREHHRLADCTMARARRMRIVSEAEVPYQLDGDPAGFLPIDVEVVPGRLTMVVPQARDR